MGKFGKIFGVILLIFCIAVAGLIAFVHYYLTDERVKSLVIPQAEAALGRKVAIGDIKIGLLSGITINNFIIKEFDNNQNFVSAKAFVLSYDLMPLLQKKIVISEIRFDEPTVQVIRDKNGKFNFSSLAFLSGDGKNKEGKEKKPSSAALPVALTFNQIRFNRAQIKIRDHLNKIPDVDATISAQLHIALGRTLEALQYTGSYDIDAAVELGTLKSRIKGKGNINQKDLDIILDTNLDGDLVHVEADIKSYFKSPDATIAISSKSLNMDKLLIMFAGMEQTEPGTSKTVQPKKGTSTDIIAESLPSGLVANGTVKVDKALYRGITTNNFALIFNLSKGIFTAKEVSAQAYGGKMDSNLVVDLNRPGLSYNGNLGLDSMQAGDLSSALAQRAAGMLSGSLQSAMTFSGAGTSWSELKNVLNADGSFTLVDGGIKGTPVSSSISTLLGLQELNNITYKNITGTFKVIDGGKVRIKSNLQGVDINAEAEGIIGLDGSLDLPLTLHLSPALADKLKSRGSFAKYLGNEQGGSTLYLKLTGNIKSPKPTLDMKGAKDQIQKVLQDRIFNKTDSSSQDADKKESPVNIIKGLFGK